MGDDSRDIFYWDVTNSTTGKVTGNAGVSLLNNAPAAVRRLVCLNKTGEGFVLYLFSYIDYVFSSNNAL
jgi:hypothetical protein